MGYTNTRTSVNDVFHAFHYLSQHTAVVVEVIH